MLISSFFSVKPHVLFLAQDEEESLSDGSTASCPTGKRPVKSVSSATTEHGFTTISSGVSVADYFARKMAALKPGNSTEVSRAPKDRTEIVRSYIIILFW